MNDLHPTEQKTTTVCMFPRPQSSVLNHYRFEYFPRFFENKNIDCNMSLHLTHLFRLVCNRVKMEKRKLSVEYMLMDIGKICSPLIRTSWLIKGILDFNQDQED